MSLGATAALAARQSQFAGALLGALSPYGIQGWQATTPFHPDDTARVQSSDGSQPQFNGSVRYPLIKNSTLVGFPVFKVDVSAGVLGGGIASAAYVNNLGDQLVQSITLRYGSNILQTIPHHTWEIMWRRLTRHDNHLEPVLAQVLGGLPPGGSTEAVRGSGAGGAVVTGLTLFVPLNELYFKHSKDQYWMPEAHALEAEIILQLAPLARLVYSDTGGDAFAGGTAPALSAGELFYQEITLSAAEKENRLKVYASEQGHVIKFLDLERQENFNLGSGGGTGLARTVRVPLDNFRMDIAEILFVVRISSDTSSATAPAVDKDWAGDAMESSTTASIVTGASVACAIPITSFRLEANGKQIYQEQTEFFNRTEQRKRYHKDAQIADPFYMISFANFPEDRRNATGHISASVLGKLELVLTLTDWAVAQTLRVDCYAHSHNIMQHRSGGVTKALH